MPSVLVDRCLTLQIEIRLNCYVLGRDACSDFLIARAMPVRAALFPQFSQRGFRNIYELWLGSGAAEAVTLRLRITRQCPETRRL